ncbi:hypothetical protein BN1263300110 [Stenotrophomonas maltophilia]|nr:hypothetical protein BN1263300110 [Stenotrophomonas maltophilia]
MTASVNVVLISSYRQVKPVTPGGGRVLPGPGTGHTETPARQVPGVRRNHWIQGDFR